MNAQKVRKTPRVENYRKLAGIPGASYQKILEALRIVSPSQSSIDYGILNAWEVRTTFGMERGLEARPDRNSDYLRDFWI